MDYEESKNISTARNIEPDIYLFAEEFVRTLLLNMGIAAEVQRREGATGMLIIIKTRDAGILIGEDGQHLQALNYIVRRTCAQRFKAEKVIPPFSLDINDYQTKRVEQLKDLARMNAQRVRYFKKEVQLQPMSSYDRRIVHLALEEHPDIITESAGEGPTRRIVIKPLE